MDELRHLNCPFTWKMEKMIFSSESLTMDNSQSKSQWNNEADEELGDITIIKLMYSVMLAFEYGEKGDLEKAMEKIEESEQIFIQLEHAPNGICSKSVDHIIKSTKCFILKKMNKPSDVKNILKSIRPCDKGKHEIGTLYGCQSIAWSFYYAGECKKAIEIASKAVELNSDNGIWHLILGKSLRRQRRFSNIKKRPNLEEQTAFKKAFQLLPTNLYIGIYYAQMCRESWMTKKAKDAYTKVLSMKPDSCDIYLKLALGFIRTNDCAKASVCLNYVASKTPEDITYLHYKGIYLQKCVKDYKEALKYFERAGALGNFSADMTYINLKKVVSNNTYDPRQYLLNMLERYKSIEYKIQSIHLHIGSYSYSQKNVKEACEHYLKAIKIDPQNTILENFYDHTSVINIYDIMKSNIIPTCKNQLLLVDRSACEMLREAEEICNKYNTRRDMLQLRRKARLLQGACKCRNLLKPCKEKNS